MVAIIPARAGSKRLPGKNVTSLAGKPLVAHTIEAALGCSLVQAVYVSSEDAEVRRTAAEWGAAVIERPQGLAGDEVQNREVVRHALQTLAGRGEGFDHVVLLQPTSPLRTGLHLQACLSAYLDRAAASTMSVCPSAHHPAAMVALREGLAEPWIDGADLDRRPDGLVPAFRPNGAIHALPTRTFLAQGRFVVAPCLAYVMRPEDSVDVDTALDLALAEVILRRRAGETEP